MGILEEKGVSKGYGEAPVLKRLDLSVEEGESLRCWVFPAPERRR